MAAPTTSAHRTCSRAASRQAGRSSLPKATRARHRPTRSFCSAVRRHLHAFHPSARAGRARCRLRRRALSRCSDDAAYPPKPCRASQPQQRGSLRPARPEVSRTAQRQRSASFSVGTVASACLPMSTGHIFAPSHRWPHQQRPSSSTMHMPLPQQRGSSLIRFSLTFSPCYFTGSGAVVDDRSSMRKNDAMSFSSSASRCAVNGLAGTSRWSRRQESNLYLPLRRRPFYPLNYGEQGGAASAGNSRMCLCKPISSARSK